MIDESLKLFAITPVKYMDVKCNTSDIVLVTRNCFRVISIQLSCYVPCLIPLLPTAKIVHIQELFKVLDNPRFFTHTREVKEK